MPVSASALVLKIPLSTMVVVVVGFWSTILHFFVAGRERNQAFSSPIDATGRAVIRANVGSRIQFLVALFLLVRNGAVQHEVKGQGVFREEECPNDHP